MNRLKELRNKNSLTLRALGQKVDMSSSRLSQYETGKREPKLETWQKLANYFNVSVPYLQGAATYELLDPLEKGLYDHVTVAMDRVFNEYALLPKAREKILKAIAYSIDNGEFN